MGTCQSCWIAASCAASSGVSSLWRLSIGAGVGSSCCTVLLNFTAAHRRHFVFVACDCCFIKVHFSSGNSECAPLKFPRWCFESLWCFSFYFLQTNKPNLHISLPRQPMTCIRIHIWTSAYMLNSVLDLIPLFLFLGDNVPGCCYYQRYQNRKICQTSKSEFITVIHCHPHCPHYQQPLLVCKSAVKLLVCPLTWAEHLQCKAVRRMFPALKHTAAVNVTVNLKGAAALVLTCHPQRDAAVVVPHPGPDAVASSHQGGSAEPCIIPARRGRGRRSGAEWGGWGGCWEVDLPKEVWERCCWHARVIKWIPYRKTAFKSRPALFQFIYVCLWRCFSGFVGTEVEVCTLGALSNFV